MSRKNIFLTLQYRAVLYGGKFFFAQSQISELAVDSFRHLRHGIMSQIRWSKREVRGGLEGRWEGGVTHWSPSNYCLGAVPEWGRWPRMDGNSDMARTNKQYRRLQNSASPLAPPYRRNPSARDQSFPNTALGSGRLGEGGGGALCLLTIGHFCPCY